MRKAIKRRKVEIPLANGEPWMPKILARQRLLYNKKQSNQLEELLIWLVMKTNLARKRPKALLRPGIFQDFQSKAIWTSRRVTLGRIVSTSLRVRGNPAK